MKSVVLSLLLFAGSALVSACASPPKPQPVVATFGPVGAAAGSSATGSPGAENWDQRAAHFRQGSPEDEAHAIFNRDHVPSFLEICEVRCRLPGFLPDEERRVRESSPRIRKVPGLDGSLNPLPPEAISYLEAANDFANRFNREMNLISRRAEENRHP